MFLSLNNLNEGGANETRTENRKIELYEGDNPKSNVNQTSWQTTKDKSHVNLNWQKLRK